MSPNFREDKYKGVWIALAVGAAIGVAYAASRRDRGGLAVAKRMTRQLAANGADIADTGRDMMERLGVIYEEARKVVDDATELWSQSRRLMRRAA